MHRDQSGSLSTANEVYSLPVIVLQKMSRVKHRCCLMTCMWTWENIISVCVRPTSETSYTWSVRLSFYSVFSFLFTQHHYTLRETPRRPIREPQTGHTNQASLFSSHTAGRHDGTSQPLTLTLSRPAWFRVFILVLLDSLSSARLAYVFQC